MATEFERVTGDELTRYEDIWRRYLALTKEGHRDTSIATLNLVAYLGERGGRLLTEIRLLRGEDAPKFE